MPASRVRSEERAEPRIGCATRPKRSGAPLRSAPGLPGEPFCRTIGRPRYDLPVPLPTQTDADACPAALAMVPAGRWAVGVSGGADSVALLLLLADRPDVSPHVVHLDHETRAGASAEDAGFVRDLAERLNL